MDNNFMTQVHYSVGTGAGQIINENDIEKPIVMMYFAKNEEILEQIENETVEYDPTDTNNWLGIALTIDGARHLIEDLQEMIDEAIQGPPLDNENEY